MALARIITRSQACSRELALDLLARGYAVEIVTPDSVPDSIADLELRVEEDRGNQLVASVEAHDGARSASLDFVHHLRAPMADFIRRVPETVEVIYLSGEPASFNPESSIAQLESPTKGAQLAPETAFAAVQIPVDPHSVDPLPTVSSQEEGARPLSLPDSLPSRPVETVTERPSYLAEETPTIAWPVVGPITAPPARVQPEQKVPRRARSARWQWRAALIFVSMVSLALVVEFGLRRTEKASTQVPGAAAAEKVAAPSTDTDLLAAAASERNLQKDPENVAGQVSNLAVLPTAIESGRNSDHAPKTSTVANTGAAVIKASIINKTTVGKTVIRKTTGGKTGGSRHDDGLIARDTVTYLDGRYKPAPKAQPAKPAARRRPASHKHSGGVIAANSLTYLNKPTPKPAK
jgi:hypothetical protein